MMQSKFSGINLITTHFGICVQHEKSTLMVDNIRFNIFLLKNYVEMMSKWCWEITLKWCLEINAEMISRNWCLKDV